ERAGRNQRARATALGQGSSPSISRVARRPLAQYAPPAWSPGARPLARGASGGTRAPPDKISGGTGRQPLTKQAGCGAGAPQASQTPTAPAPGGEGAGLRARPYPFTAPAVSPRVRKRSKKKKSTMIGTV